MGSITELSSYISSSYYTAYGDASVDGMYEAEEGEALYLAAAAYESCSAGCRGAEAEEVRYSMSDSPSAATERTRAEETVSPISV